MKRHGGLISFRVRGWVVLVGVTHRSLWRAWDYERFSDGCRYWHLGPFLLDVGPWRAPETVGERGAW